jgi:uncharacterized membrane protein
MSIENGLLLLDGIPLHPLIVHVTVVVLPLGVLMVIASLFWKWFRKYDLLTLTVMFVGTVAAFMTSFAGQALAINIGVSLEHAQPGLFVPVASLVATVFFGLLVWSRRLDIQTSIAKFTKGSFAVVVVASVSATLALTVLAGHSGAKLSWDPKMVDIISEN